jgi:hypothetical protein
MRKRDLLAIGVLLDTVKTMEAFQGTMLPASEDDAMTQA